MPQPVGVGHGSSLPALIGVFRDQYKIVRSQILPQIFGTVSELRQEQSLAFGGPIPTLGKTFNTYNLAINLSWEVDIWGRIASQTEAAIADYFGSIEARRTVVLALVSSVAGGYILLRQYDMQLDIAHQKNKELAEVRRHQVQVLTDYLRLANLQYNNGQTDYLNVLDAERTLFASQLNFAQTQANCFITLVDLYKALGGGWVLEADQEALILSND